MKQRCVNHKDYGARGIKVCDLWLNEPKRFYEWAMDNGFNNSLEIDREDNNGNYEPSNCRFVTRKVNQQNKRLYKVKGSIQKQGRGYRIRVANIDYGYADTLHYANIKMEAIVKKINIERNR